MIKSCQAAEGTQCLRRIDLEGGVRCSVPRPLFEARHPSCFSRSSCASSSSCLVLSSISAFQSVGTTCRGRENRRIRESTEGRQEARKHKRKHKDKCGIEGGSASHLSSVLATFLLVPPAMAGPHRWP